MGHRRSGAAKTIAPWEVDFDLAVKDDLDDVRELLRGHLRQGKWEPPVMPSTVRQALVMARDPEASFGGIAGVLEADPALTAQLLKLANSPMFSGAVPVSGLRQALVRIGLRGFVQLLMVASLSKVLVVRGHRGITAKLQERATAVGVAAAEIARATRMDRDAAFTAGVLHDVGIAMGYGLMQACERYLQDDVKDSPAKKWEVVEEMHEELGLKLSEAWKLPPTVCGAVGFHHDPESAPPASQKMAWLVAAAIHVVDHADIRPERPLDCPLGERAFFVLGLALSRLPELAHETRSRMGLVPIE